MLFRQGSVGLQLGNDGMIGAAHGNGNGAGSLHHHALHDRLTANINAFLYALIRFAHGYSFLSAEEENTFTGFEHFDAVRWHSCRIFLFMRSLSKIHGSDKIQKERRITTLF